MKAQKSHYNRKKSRRLYLPAELNISRLWKLYNSTGQIQGATYFFYEIFKRDFNLGFYFRKRVELKNCPNADAKVPIMIELRIHKLRAKQFYLLMKQYEENYNR